MRTMSTEQNNPDGRFPTTGPGTKEFERYQHTQTDENDGLIYDLEKENAWIESSLVLSLESWQ